MADPQNFLHDDDLERSSAMGSEDEEDAASSKMDTEHAAAQAEAEWGEWEEGAEEDDTQSLFGAKMLPSPEAAMAHDAAKYGFDLKAYAAQVRVV